MRKKRRGSGDILIDLTSLLDVIFIMLLVVVCYQQSVTREAEAEQREAVEQSLQAQELCEDYEELLKETQTTMALYSDQLDTADKLNEYVWAASVYSRYKDYEHVTERHIEVLREGEEIAGFDLYGNNTDALEDFKNILVKYITDHSDRPVILSLNEDDDNILYRDEVAIQGIFTELASEYSNVFIK